MRVTVCVCVEISGPLCWHTRSSRCSIHDRGERERERDHRNHCTLSPVPHPSPLASSERLLSRKPMQSWLYAPHITTTYALCTSCTARSLCECTHTHRHDCCWELRYGDIRRLASKFTTSSTIQRKAAPHRSGALSERRRFVTLSTDECMRTLMWFVWNSDTCISFFFFLPANPSVQPLLTPKEISYSFFSHLEDWNISDWPDV